MFVGREKELATLEQAYNADSFQMVVVYGRRRVGKTTLLTHFAKGMRTLFFTAQQQNDADNLADFSESIAKFFNLPSSLRFSSWTEALDYIADQALQEPFLFIFDEFPYAALANKSLASKLQIAIDHRFSKTKMCMVLCGSNQGFMESDVLGKKSPLHGRRTMQMRIEPFDYLVASRMLPSVSNEDAFKYYACIGGVPYYLSQIDTRLSFKKNIARLYFSPDGFLFEEPLMLLRQELREPALYNSILRAIGTGANKRSEIASRANVDATSLSSYLSTLEQLGIIERIVPFGENPETSRKGIYRFKDACYDFWYTFVMPQAGDILSGAGRIVAENITSDVLNTYLGRRFERVCLQWMLAQSLDGELPISASQLGSWWGGDPSTHEQSDIDIVAANRQSRHALVGECKWRNSFNESEAEDKLRQRAGLLKNTKVVGYYLFSKKALSQGTRDRAQKTDDLYLVTLDDLYRKR